MVVIMGNFKGRETAFKLGDRNHSPWGKLTEVLRGGEIELDAELARERWPAQRHRQRAYRRLPTATYLVFLR